MKAVNSNLTRDERYAAAKARLGELQAERDSLERKLDAAINDVNKGSVHRNRIAEEASSLIAGASAAAAQPSSASLIQTLEQLRHRLAVVREAIEQQKHALGDLRTEVSKAIATDLLPVHRTKVEAIVEAALVLAQAVQAEEDMRQELYDNDVACSAVIRPMSIPGFNMDPNNRLGAYLREAYEYGYIDASVIPAKILATIPPSVKPKVIAGGLRSLMNAS